MGRRCASMSVDQSDAEHQCSRADRTTACRWRISSDGRRRILLRPCRRGHRTCCAARRPAARANRNRMRRRACRWAARWPTRRRRVHRRHTASRRIHCPIECAVRCAASADKARTACRDSAPKSGRRSESVRCRDGRDSPRPRPSQTSARIDSRSRRKGPCGSRGSRSCCRHRYANPARPPSRTARQFGS